MNLIKRIRNKIPEVLAAASLIALQLGHKYQKGKLVGREIVALAIENLLPCSDKELPDRLEDNGLLELLGYKKKPESSVFSHTRKDIGMNAVMEILNFLTRLFYNDKFVRLFAIDSKFIPTYSKDDKDSDWGHVTLPKRDQTKEKKSEIKQGYKLHTILDAERDIPLFSIILPANEHDSTVFSALFEYVRQNFKIAHEAKFLADSAYDSTDIRETLMKYNILPVIAVNGRGHYESTTPKDPEYGKRWSIERFFSKLQRKVGILNNRFIGMRSVAFHVYSVLFGYFIRYIL